MTEYVNGVSTEEDTDWQCYAPSVIWTGTLLLPGSVEDMAMPQLENGSLLMSLPGHHELTLVTAQPQIPGKG